MVWPTISWAHVLGLTWDPGHQACCLPVSANQMGRNSWPSRWIRAWKHDWWDSMDGLPPLWDEGPYLELQASFSPLRSPAPEELCLIRSGWQMEPCFSINFYYTFRWRCSSCIWQSIWQSPTGFGFDFLSLWGSCQGVFDGHQCPSTTLPAPSTVIYGSQGRIGINWHLLPESYTDQVSGTPEFSLETYPWGTPCLQRSL